MKVHLPDTISEEEINEEIENCINIMMKAKMKNRGFRMKSPTSFCETLTSL